MVNKDFLSFMIVLLRTSIFFSLFPIFGSKNLPPFFRAGLSLVLSMVVFSFIEVNFNNMSIQAIIITEVLWGIILSLSLKLVFFAVDMTGQIMSNTMGLSLATIYNPEMGQSTEISRLYGIIAMFIFLTTDSHHQLIYLLIKSYEVPLSIINLGQILKSLLEVTLGMFIIAVKMASPVLIGMIISNLIAGFLHKAVPQLNVFFVLFPVFAFIGFSLMIISLPLFIKVFIKSINGIEKNLENLIVLMRS